MHPHIHLGVVEGAAIFLTVLLFGSLYRLAALKMGDTPMARAMLFAY